MANCNSHNQRFYQSPVFADEIHQKLLRLASIWNTLTDDLTGDISGFDLPGLVMTVTVRHGESMTLIEIVDFPMKNGDGFHSEPLNNQMIN